LQTLENILQPELLGIGDFEEVSHVQQQTNEICHSSCKMLESSYISKNKFGQFSPENDPCTRWI